MVASPMRGRSHGRNRSRARREHRVTVIRQDLLALGAYDEPMSEAQLEDYEFRFLLSGRRRRR
jgi:hypothetical protein